MGERGREVPEIRDGRTRELLVQRYRLMYEVSDSGIDIVAFVHGPRLRPPASPTIARRAPRPANRDPNARPE
jgi:plasmid stabilization system protein ParE